MAGGRLLRSSMAVCVALLLLAGVSAVAAASPGHQDPGGDEAARGATPDPATPGPAVAALRDALEQAPGFVGLVPASEESQHLLALFDGPAPATLPHDLVPAGWTLEARGDLRYEPLHYVTDEPLVELHGPHGPPAPEDSVGIGPGSTLLTEFYDPEEDATFVSLCTAGFVFRDASTGKVYLGAAGHCFMGRSFTATHGDDADWDPADTLRVRVCVSDCLGGAGALFSAALGVYPSETRDLGVGDAKLDYARASGLGSDFGLVEIPPELFDEVRTDMPVWNGPGTSDPTRQVQAGDPLVHYGSGAAVGETFPSRGRTGPGVTADENRWLADLVSSSGDSGSAVNIATTGDEDVVEGHWAAGILTHRVVGVGIVGGTNTARAITMAEQEAGFDLRVVDDPAALEGGGEDPPEPEPDPEPELSNLEHVYNFDPGEHEPGASPRVGSDLEFFSHTVPLRDYATGELIDASGDPLPAGTEPVLAERDFAVMGSYQRGGYVFDITDPEDPQFVSQVTCRQDRNDVAIRKFTDPETGETRVVLALTQQSGNPCGGAGSVGVRINSPEELADFHTATQWSGTAPVDDQTADLVYAGTGCTPAHYADVDAEGRIALVDKREDADGVRDCPTFTFKQKMDAAEQAGAIGLVQVDEDDEPSAGNAIDSGIPGLEISNSAGVPVRDAVLAGTAVNASLTDGPSEVPLLGSGSGGLGVFDVTDPYEWSPMYYLRTGHGGVHNFMFHPTQPYGYASNGALPGGVNTIPIVDFTDLDAPEVRPGPQTEGGVHDLEFSPEGERAYAASENNYRIYDTTDAAEPELLSRTPNVGSYAHGVFPTSDRSLMVTNNESLVLGGFLVEGTGVCPGEGLAAYDIDGAKENAPVGPVGYYAPETVGEVGGFCTSHFGRFAPDTRVLSMGWYVAGTRIVDWSNPTAPEEVAAAVMPGANTWAAKFHEGPYVYAGDLGRGFDVFRWSGEGPAPWVTDEAGEPEAGVELSCLDCPVQVRAGESGTAQVEVENTGDREDTYQMEVEDVPDGWSARVEPEQVTVAAGERTEVTVTVEVPRRARQGEYELTVSATSSVDPNVTGATPVEVEVRKGPPSDRGRSSESDPPDEGGGSGQSDDHANGMAASHTGPLSPGSGALIVLALVAAVAAGRPAVRGVRRLGARRTARPAG